MYAAVEGAEAGSKICGLQLAPVAVSVISMTAKLDFAAR